MASVPCDSCAHNIAHTHTCAARVCMALIDWIYVYLLAFAGKNSQKIIRKHFDFCWKRYLFGRHQRCSVKRIKTSISIRFEPQTRISRNMLLLPQWAPQPHRGHPRHTKSKQLLLAHIFIFSSSISVYLSTRTSSGASRARVCACVSGRTQQRRLLAQQINNVIRNFDMTRSPEHKKYGKKHTNVAVVCSLVVLEFFILWFCCCHSIPHSKRSRSHTHTHEENPYIFHLMGLLPLFYTSIPPYRIVDSWLLMWLAYCFSAISVI